MTLALHVVSAWTAEEDPQVSGKEFTPSLLKSECIEGTQDFIKYGTHFLRSLLNLKILLQKAHVNSIQLLIHRILVDTLCRGREEVVSGK